MKRYFILLFSFLLAVSCAPAKIEKKSMGLALRDGSVVHYREAGQGPVLILIHGLASSNETWELSLDALARSYRVIALDLPGFGKSDRPKADYSVRYYAGVVKEFMDTLGIAKAALAGNSLGGWIAALVALEHPEKVNNLILVNSAGLRSGGRLPISLEPASREEEKELLLALFANQELVTDRIVDAQWAYAKEVRPAVKSVLASFKSGAPFLDDRIKEIKAPTLVIWGKQDRVIPLEAGQRFAKEIRRAKLKVIENAGHLPQIEQPEAFTCAVKGFVKSW